MPLVCQSCGKALDVEGNHVSQEAAFVCPKYNKIASPAKQEFEGGSTRSAKLERFDIIPPETLIALARRYGLGVAKHGEGNWKHGGVQFIKATINHLYAHLTALLLGQEDDEGQHSEAILWNASAINWFEQRKPQEWQQALKELQEGLVESPVRPLGRWCLAHGEQLSNTEYCPRCMQEGRYDAPQGGCAK